MLLTPQDGHCNTILKHHPNAILMIAWHVNALVQYAVQQGTYEAPMTFAQPQKQIGTKSASMLCIAQCPPRSTPVLCGTHECLGLVCARAFCRARALSASRKQLVNLQIDSVQGLHISTD